MRKNQLKFLLLCLSVFGLLFFAGCTLPNLPFLPKSPQPSPGNVTLKYWGLWETKNNIQPLIDEYQKAHPNVTIEYEERSPKFYYETLKSRLISDSAPDIARMHLTWVPKLSANLAALPASVMDSATFNSTFYPVVSKWCTQVDQIYCLPLMYDGLALVYNQSLFEKAGIANPPKTWEEFKEMAQKLTVKDGQGKIIQAGAALGTAENVTEFSDLLGLLMLHNGVQFQDSKTGKVTFQETISPDGRNTGAEAVEFYTQFAKGKGQVWDPSLGESTAAFAAGKVAMIFASSWRLQNVLNANPALKVVATAVPQLTTPEGGLTNINWASFWVEGVAQQSTHQAEAWDFLKFITEKEQLLNFQKTVTTTSAARLFGEIYPRQDISSLLLSDLYLEPYVTGAPAAETWYFCDRTWDGLLNDTIKGFLSQAVASVVNGGSAESSLNVAAQSIQALFDQKDE